MYLVNSASTQSRGSGKVDHDLLLVTKLQLQLIDTLRKKCPSIDFYQYMVINTLIYYVGHIHWCSYYRIVVNRELWWLLKGQRSNMNKTIFYAVWDLFLLSRRKYQWDETLHHYYETSAYVEVCLKITNKKKKTKYFSSLDLINGQYWSIINARWTINERELIKKYKCVYFITSKTPKLM